MVASFPLESASGDTTHLFGERGRRKAVGDNKSDRICIGRGRTVTVRTAAWPVLPLVRCVAGVPVAGSCPSRGAAPRAAHRPGRPASRSVRTPPAVLRRWPQGVQSLCPTGYWRRAEHAGCAGRVTGVVCWAWLGHYFPCSGTALVPGGDLRQSHPAGLLPRAARSWSRIKGWAG